MEFIHPERLDSPEAAHRFRIEAQAAAGLNHPNIVTIYAVGQRDGVHFLSMELVDGHPLSQLIPPGGFVREILFLAKGRSTPISVPSHEMRKPKIHD